MNKVLGRREKVTRKDGVACGGAEGHTDWKEEKKVEQGTTRGNQR